MRRVRIVLVLGGLAACIYWYFAVPYVTAAATIPVAQSGQPVVCYFWLKNRHLDQFRVGELYQLQHRQQYFTGRLVSISYASNRVAEVKLGFELQAPLSEEIWVQQRFKVSIAPDAAAGHSLLARFTIATE